jgi:hypothetical protein
MLGTPYSAFPRYNLMNEYDTDWESWQWQPTLTLHDPNPPITLEDPLPSVGLKTLMLMGMGR